MVKGNAACKNQATCWAMSMLFILVLVGCGGLLALSEVNETKDADRQDQAG